MCVSSPTGATRYGLPARSLSDGRERDHVGRRGDHRALHLRLVEVVGREAALGMERADAEHAGVRADGADEVDGRRADGDLRALVEPPADHLRPRRPGGRRARRRSAASSSARCAAGSAGRRRASSRLVVEPSSSTTRARGEQADARPRRARPSRRCRSRARCTNEPGCGAGGSAPPWTRWTSPCAASSRRSRRIVSSDTPSSSTSRAATTFPSRAERGEDRLAALGGEQPVGCTFLHGRAGYCMIQPALAKPGGSWLHVPARTRTVLHGAAWVFPAPNL